MKPYLVSVALMISATSNIAVIVEQRLQMGQVI
jgi:hypothetical protein